MIAFDGLRCCGSSREGIQGDSFLGYTPKFAQKKYKGRIHKTNMPLDS